MEPLALWKTAFEEVEAGARQLREVEAHAMDFIDHLKQHLVQNPEPVFAVLRRVAPVLRVKDFVLLTRRADVQEVLNLENIFQVPYAEKTIKALGRNFFLGMQNSPEYERDTALMRTVMRREDVPATARFIAGAAGEIVTASKGRLEVVSQLGRVVPTRWAIWYFGCQPPSEQDLASWTTAVFQYLFLDFNNDPAVAQSALDASARLRAWLDGVIARRAASSSGSDDVLGRCLKLQSIGAPGMDNEGIRANLSGLLIGAVATNARCVAQSLDELLKRPDQLAAAQDAARSGNDSLLAQYVFEALRFNPNNPILVRICAEDYTVAKGTPRATAVPRGATVIPATMSAMFDESFVDAPGEFRAGRPAYVYINWGYGLHTCFGQYVNQVQLPGILKPLLQQRALRRAPGSAGQLQYSGPFPSSLSVEFDA